MDTSDATVSAKAPAEPAASQPVPSDSTATWTVQLSRIGPVRVGMSSDELRATDTTLNLPADSESCRYVRSERWRSGVSAMLAGGTVARIDVDSAGVRTAEGIGVGDPDTRLSEVYGGRAVVTPHKYVPGGKYYSVRGTSPADSSHRIVFETESGRVTRFRVGRTPEVEWVERCG